MRIIGLYYRDADLADHLQTRDLKNVLATLVDILRKEYSSSNNSLIPAQEFTALYRNPLLCDEKRLIKDVKKYINDNDDDDDDYDETNRQIDVGIQSSKDPISKNTKYEEEGYDPSSRCMKNCAMRKFRFVDHDKFQRRNCTQEGHVKTNVMRTENQMTRSTETGECNCTDSKKCHEESDCGYFCCTNYSRQSDVRNRYVKGSSSLPMKRNDDKFARKVADGVYKER